MSKVRTIRIDGHLLAHSTLRGQGLQSGHMFNKWRYIFRMRLCYLVPKRNKLFIIVRKGSPFSGTGAQMLRHHTKQLLLILNGLKGAFFVAFFYQLRRFLTTDHSNQTTYHAF